MIAAAHYANFYTAIGVFCAAIILLVLWVVTGLWGCEVWRRLTRAYHLTVILYWLDRLEKGGVRVFQKAEAEDAQKKQQGGEA